MVMGDNTLRTKYVGGNSRFPDVRADVYFYNASALSVDRGLIRVDNLSGEFRPDDQVSGSDAVLAMKRLQTGLPER